MRPIELLRQKVESSRQDWKMKMIPRKRKNGQIAKVEVECIYAISTPIVDEQPEQLLCIGETKQLYKRFSNHQGGYLYDNYNSKLVQSVREYGWDAHDKEILLRFPQRVSNEKRMWFETLFIQHFMKEGRKLLNVHKTTVPIEYVGEKNIRRQEQEIGQYTRTGELVKVWRSMAEAAKTLNISQGNISLCCNGSKTKRKVRIYSVGGFVWRRMWE